MNQKEFEDRLDGYADKISSTVTDGVKRLEAAVDSGKENIRKDADEAEGARRLSGSPRMGVILVGLGIAWLLHTLGVFDHFIFPILAIVLGIYFILRHR